MVGSGTQQGAFDWNAQHEREAGANRAEGLGRSGTPPAEVGGGAPSALERTAREKDGPRRIPKSAPAPLPPDNELWDVHAAARYLKRSVSWVYHKAEDGTLPVKRLGGWGVRFVAAELRAWVERQHMNTDGGR